MTFFTADSEVRRPVLNFIFNPDFFLFRIIRIKRMLYLGIWKGLHAYHTVDNLLIGYK